MLTPTRSVGEKAQLGHVSSVSHKCKIPTLGNAIQKSIAHKLVQTSYFRRACALIRSVVRTLMSEPSATEGATTLPLPLGGLARPQEMGKRLKRSADSPVSVVHGCAANQEVLETHKQMLLPLTLATCLAVYSQLLGQQLWKASFSRGRRASRTDARPKDRTLVTRHLSAAGTDGWNVVAGAVQLAQAWALLAEDIPAELTGKYEYPIRTRLRLAVCLSVSWKFQRCNCSQFPRRFDTEPPSLLGPHTHELATLGYFFMTGDEQQAFGGFHVDNAEAIRKLYDDMLEHEVDLLACTNVFSLLTDNVQVQAEAWVGDLFERGVVTAEGSMATRSIVPLFIYCASEGRVLTAGGLVCAALLALSTATHPRAKLAHSEAQVRAEFSQEERLEAWGLLHNALFPSKMAAYMVQNTCYSDLGFENYDFVEDCNLRAAQVLAAAVAA